MKLTTLASAALAFYSFILPASAADDPALARLAHCQDSWADWNKSDPARLKAFVEHFQTQFSRNGNDPLFVPKQPMSIAGLRVTQAFPQSIGMGVGFSLTVDATFDEARAAMQKAIGKPLQKCESGDGMRTCEREIAPQRTFTLMAEDDAKSLGTLIGCYYFYEK